MWTGQHLRGYSHRPEDRRTRLPGILRMPVQRCVMGGKQKILNVLECGNADSQRKYHCSVLRLLGRPSAYRPDSWTRDGSGGAPRTWELLGARVDATPMPLASTPHAGLQIKLGVSVPSGRRMANCQGACRVGPRGCCPPTWATLCPRPRDAWGTGASSTGLRNRLSSPRVPERESSRRGYTCPGR